MNTSQRDRLVGAVLLAVALSWLGLVYETIPPVASAVVGPRAFPLLLGSILAVLSAVMVVRSFGGRNVNRSSDPDDANRPPATWLEVKIAGGIFLLIVGYGYLLERAGFRLATVVIVATAMIGLLNVRRPILILCFSFGISIGCWVFFDKLLGAHMPVGSWTAWS
jgi:hypothetical protein